MAWESEHGSKRECEETGTDSKMARSRAVIFGMGGWDDELPILELCSGLCQWAVKALVCTMAVLTIYSLISEPILKYGDRPTF
jgi:hypothetical protein